MSKDKKPTATDKPKPAARPQPSYVQFQGGYSGGNHGGKSGGGNRPAASGSPIRRSAPRSSGK